MNFQPCATCGKHPYPIYLKLDEVTAIFGVCPATVYDWIARAGFPGPVKLGKNTSRWIQEDVHAWAAQQAQRKAS